VPICGRVIPIIEDIYIEFGTGLKVTPAHDMNDKVLEKTQLRNY
jgi:valyl-tRNA synthetase